jgi:homoserine dehydrogenase
MVNVEADVVAGKYLSDLAFANDVIYSMAYGDQPALILEQIEWALLNGFEVICAGKGTKYHKNFEDSTPETVWQHYGIKAKDALSSGMNPKMFNSFLTGDKSSIEMAAVANSSHLKVPDTGLNYPCINTNQIAKQLIPMESGGLLEKNRQLEVITSIDENKKEIDNHLRWGVFLVFKGKNNYVKNCFSDYGMIVDDTGEYTALWRPYHYIGLELAQSIYSIALNKQATGYTKSYKADVAAVAKVNLYPGDILDGEGGYKVKGKLVNSLISHKKNILPLGLSDNIKVIKPILKNSFISFDDVENNLNNEIIKAREYQFQLLEK